MWDNASAMHLAICDYALPERRLMHRTTVIGSEPVLRCPRDSREPDE